MNDDDDVQKDPVFYYSRERRLNRAPQAVRDMYEGNIKRPGFFKSFFATKGNFMVFMVIVIAAVTGLATRFSGRERETGVKLGANTLALIIVQEEEAQVLGISKNAPKSGEFYTGPVDVAVSPVAPKPKEGAQQEAPPVFSHRIIFNPAESEIYRLPLPFDKTEYFVLLKTGDEQKTIRIRVREIKEDKK